jgi:hypothetical protein
MDDLATKIAKELMIVWRQLMASEYAINKRASKRRGFADHLRNERIGL